MFVASKLLSAITQPVFWLALWWALACSQDRRMAMLLEKLNCSGRTNEPNFSGLAPFGCADCGGEAESRYGALSC